MKVTSRERFLLIILVFVLILFGYHKFIYTNQRSKINDLSNKKIEYSSKLDKFKLDSLTREKNEKEIKVFNVKLKDAEESFFTSIVQERVIVLLDDIINKTKISNQSLNFTELNSKTQDKNEKSQDDKTKKTPSPIEKMQVTMNYRGEFANLIKFINEIEDNPKKIIIKNLNIAEDENGQVSGNILLEFPAIPALGGEKKDEEEWEYNGEYGKWNPFDLVSSKSNAANIQGNKAKEKADFLMSVRPTSSDLPTVILGKSKDEKRNTYVYADSNNIEEVEINFDEQDDRFFYKYKTSIYSYPKNYNEDNVQFIPNGEKIIIEIYSASRNSDKDVSGVNIKISNNTSKQVVAKIFQEDLSRPRINILNMNGNIKIEK